MSQAMLLNQLAQLENPDSRLMFTDPETEHNLLQHYARGVHGLSSKDAPRWTRYFWEVKLTADWELMQSTPETTQPYDGCNLALFWEKGVGGLSELGKQGKAVLVGRLAWNKPGIAASQMGDLPSCIYGGWMFDENVAVISPENPEHVSAMWAFCESGEFSKSVRRIDQALKTHNATLVKVPFDLDHWQNVAKLRYPDGLPEPHSDDMAQWLFRGDIPSSENALHVAAARLLGFYWPDQPEGPIDGYVDEDGIVTLAPLVNQDGFAGRLRALLQAAYESEAPIRPKGASEPAQPRIWNELVIPGLLSNAASSGMSLEEWLRDKFFEAHTKLFQQRPFIWHIWDGCKDGFHAYVNYHKLDKKNLERLTHVYLGDWIERQRAASDDGDSTADARLVAALELQMKLELIRIGEPPYDIFVRWKSLAEQPIGWDPDLNDGVRMNIRPFVEAGILRIKVNVNWRMDRGKDPKPNISGTVERHNDLHFTLAEKEEARKSIQTS